jgi:hypothetical protein
MSELENDGFYVSPEELAIFLEKDRIIKRHEWEKVIFDKFKDKAEFKEYITKPQRPQFRKLRNKDFPEHCATCEYYGDMRSFEVNKCILFSDWPVSRPQWGTCDGYKCDEEKVRSNIRCQE